MTDPREYRGFELTELRAVRDTFQLSGHAAVFNRLSQDLGGFREQVAPGAFAQSIVEDDIRALVNHKDEMVLARNRSGTLRLSEDALGLYTEISMPDTQYARDLLAVIERGDVNQMSFGFIVPPGGDSIEDMDGTPLRTLRRVNLFDVSPVTFPAYPQTDLEIKRRCIAQWEELVEPEAPVARLLRERYQRLAELEA